MTKDKWMEKMCSIKNLTAGRLMMMVIALGDDNTSGEVREFLLCMALGCTAAELNKAHAHLVELGLALITEKPWLH